MKRLYSVSDEYPDNYKITITLNGEVVYGVYQCRAGSKGWVDSLVMPLTINSTYDAVVRNPRMRGVVEVLEVFVMNEDELLVELEQKR